MDRFFMEHTQMFANDKIIQFAFPHMTSLEAAGVIDIFSKGPNCK